jgi:hypothetical protein
VSVVDLTPDVEAPDNAEELDGLARTVELKGKRFPVRAEGVSLLALMKFATVAKRQAALKAADPDRAGEQEMEGLAALYALLRSCIDPASWDQFEDHANDAGAGQEDLMRVVQQAAQAGARPTQLPSGSPGGRSTTGTSSAAGSSSPGSSVPMGSVDVQHDLEQRGRPDMAVVVMRAREASTSSSGR